VPIKISIGELRTRIRIQHNLKTIGSSGFNKDIWVDIGNISDTEQPKYIFAKWQNAFGNEVWVAESAQVKNSATVTVRYNFAITNTCRIIRDDGMVYQIVGIDDVDQRHRFMQIKVKAMVNA
jgi:SPP1 family predicted phage head-tail adaptor